MSRTGQDWWYWDGAGWVTLRTGVSITIPDVPDDDDPTTEPDPAARNVLLVTATGGLSPGDQALHDILVADNWTVTVRSYDAAEDYSGISVVVLRAGTTTDQGRYLFAPVGIVAIDCWRTVGMGTTLGYDRVNDVEVVDSSSPLAGGQSGTFDAYLSPQFITWNPDPHPGLQTVVTRAGQPDQRVVFAFEAGSEMPHRFASTRHVGMGFHTDGFAAGLTAASRSQVLAAVRWARDTALVGVSAPAVPSGLAAAPGDGQVRLSWNPAQFAETYVVRRHTVTGGPYTDVASQIAATTYTDTTAVNDTAYFYVVAAKNGSGVSDDSAEVSATPTATSTEDLSLLVSTAEVSMWRSRATSGPFRVAGDFSPNSPGHWSEMVAASTADWSAVRWTGPSTLEDGAVSRNVGTGNDPPASTRRMALSLASAAHVAVVNDNETLAQNIVNEIRWYSQQSRLNFNNTTLYPDRHFYDSNPLFIMAKWVTAMMEAYDACRVLVPADAAVENWFLGMGNVCHGNLANLNDLFPNRGSDNYVSRASLVDDGNLGPYTRLANGNVVEHLQISRWYNNRRNEMAGTQGLAGLIAGSTFLVDWAKRYVREWMMFANRTTANQWTNGDHNRGTNNYPQLGYAYDVNSIQLVLQFMEALARTGDTSLYDFSSSEGADRSPWGTNHLKTMKEVLAQRIGIIDRTIPAQYTADASLTTPPPSSVAGDPFYRIQSRHTGSNQEIVTDGWLLCAAGYYNEPSWVDVINRVGTPTGFTNPPRGAGPIVTWAVDHRTRFLRSYDSSPFT